MEKPRKKIGESSETISDERDVVGITVQRTSDPIPHDLTTEILVRLPAKSLARFLCVSKIWASTIRKPDFIKMFMTRSLTRPCLVFLSIRFYGDGKLHFFSSPHPQNPDDESSCMANHDVTLPEFRLPTMNHTVNGLICLGPNPGFVICNPSLRRFMALPEIESNVKGQREAGFFGYDPIEDQYKVLWIMTPDGDGQNLAQEIRVFTLGAREWRKIEVCPFHCPVGHGPCINGILYYQAWSEDRYYGSICQNNCMIPDLIVSFDVRSEKFNLIQLPQVCFAMNLMSYRGKLATAGYHMDGVCDLTDETMNSIKLGVLEDAENQVWSVKIFPMPPSWKDSVVEAGWLFDVGATDAGEIVLSSKYLSDPFYVLYYNPERNNLRRIEIKGMAHRDFMRGDRLAEIIQIWTFSDHVESVMFL